MRTLSTHSASVALGIERKVLDNVLAREARSLIVAGRPGRSRRIPVAVVERIALALILNRDLGVTVVRGLELATECVDAPASPVAVGPWCTIAVDLPRLREALDRSIDDALEAVAEPIRGRPGA